MNYNPLPHTPPPIYQPFPAFCNTNSINLFFFPWLSAWWRKSSLSAMDQWNCPWKVKKTTYFHFTLTNNYSNIKTGKRVFMVITRVSLLRCLIYPFWSDGKNINTSLWNSLCALVSGGDCMTFTFPCLRWQIILGMKLVDTNDTNVLEYPQKVNGIEKILDDRLCRESGWGHNRPFALTGHVTSFLWKWKLYDFAFEKRLVGHVLNKRIVIWFFKPAPFS